MVGDGVSIWLARMVGGMWLIILLSTVCIVQADNTTENINSTDHTDQITSKIIVTTTNSKKVKVNDLSVEGESLQPDVFTLHHPFIHPSITEYEFSQWYFLFFIFFDNPSKLSADVTQIVPGIIKSLSSKFSVPGSVFSISRAEKYRTKSISANLTLTNHTIPRLHHKLCSLQNTSPLFWLAGNRYKLVQVIHDKNKHLFVKENGQVEKIFTIFNKHIKLASFHYNETFN